LTATGRAVTLNIYMENREPNLNESSGDPFSSSNGPSEPVPSPARIPADPPLAMPKLWIGYILALVTFFGEIIAVSRHPEIAKQVEFGVPPLEIFLPAFVARAYWFVCIYRYHKILAAIPGYVHPISPAKAVGFHFIPIYQFFWIFKWPAAIANFVNTRLHAPAMRGWVLGVGFLGALLCQILLDAGFGVALLFLSTTYISGFLTRALATPQGSAQL
jgi:hypothetical protein